MTLGPDLSPPPSEVIEEEQPLSFSTQVNLGPLFELMILTFETVPLGETREGLITVRRIGQDSAVITAVDVSGDQEFAVAGTGCLPDVELAPGDTCEIVLVFTPTEAGERAASLLVTLSGDEQTSIAQLRGTGGG